MSEISESSLSTHDIQVVLKPKITFMILIEKNYKQLSNFWIDEFNILMIEGLNNAC